MVDQACGLSPVERERLQKEAEELADARTEALLSIEKAAREWWSRRRPRGWTKKQHLDNPTINCADAKEDTLAIAIAEWVRLGG